MNDRAMMEKNRDKRTERERETATVSYRTKILIDNANRFSCMNQFYLAHELDVLDEHYVLDVVAVVSFDLEMMSPVAVDSVSTELHSIEYIV